MPCSRTRTRPFRRSGALSASGAPETCLSQLTMPVRMPIRAPHPCLPRRPRRISLSHRVCRASLCGIAVSPLYLRNSEGGDWELSPDCPTVAAMFIKHPMAPSPVKGTPCITSTRQWVRPHTARHAEGTFFLFTLKLRSLQQVPGPWPGESSWTMRRALCTTTCRGVIREVLTTGTLCARLGIHPVAATGDRMPAAGKS